MQKNKYYLTGILIAVASVSLVFLVKMQSGFPDAFQSEPSKIAGNPDAPIYILEFSDFACPQCKIIQPALKNTLGYYPKQVKLIFKHFPLKMHPKAFKAAEAADCAGDQGKFWPFHDLLFNKVEEWNSGKADNFDHFFTYATSLQLNLIDFKTCLETGMKKEIITKNIQEGRNFMVSGTPTVIFNGKTIVTRPYQSKIFRELIDDELKRIGGGRDIKVRRFIPYILLVSRILIGLLFVYSGFSKLIRPIEYFEVAVAQYRLIPDAYLHYVCSILPWIEFLGGIYIVVGYGIRIFSPVLTVLTGMFQIVMAQALIRRLPMDECGCFGGGAIQFTLQQSFILDTVLLIGLIYISTSSENIVSLDRFLSQSKKMPS